jgi:hypothetical protein
LRGTMQEEQTREEGTGQPPTIATRHQVLAVGRPANHIHSCRVQGDGKHEVCSETTILRTDHAPQLPVGGGGGPSTQPTGKTAHVHPLVSIGGSNVSVSAAVAWLHTCNLLVCETKLQCLDLHRVCIDDKATDPCKRSVGVLCVVRGACSQLQTVCLFTCYNWVPPRAHCQCAHTHCTAPTARCTC